MKTFPNRCVCSVGLNLERGVHCAFWLITNKVLFVSVLIKLHYTFFKLNLFFCCDRLPQYNNNRNIKPQAEVMPGCDGQLICSSYREG